MGVSISIPASPCLLSLTKLIESRNPARLTFDLAKVTLIDDYGAFLLFETSRQVPGNQGECNIINADENAATLFSLVGFYSQYINSQPALSPKQANFLSGSVNPLSNRL